MPRSQIRDAKKSVMSGLQALQSYGSSDSSDEEAEDVPQSMEDTPLPGLPSEILSMFNSKLDHPAVNSNPDDHGGRVRSFEHVPGNWATFVYIPVEDPSFSTVMETLMTCLPHDTNFRPCDDLHVTLSRTVCLQYHWIEPFTQSVSEMMTGLRPFHCHLEGVDVYTNDEKTRTFIGLRIGAGHEELCKLVKLVDECLTDFSLPVYYTNPSFHVSCCWCVGDVSARIDSVVLKNMQEQLYHHCGSLAIPAREIHCKSGCRKFVFPLR